MWTNSCHEDAPRAENTRSILLTSCVDMIHSRAGQYANPFLDIPLDDEFTRNNGDVLNINPRIGAFANGDQLYKSWRLLKAKYDDLLFNLEKSVEPGARDEIFISAALQLCAREGECDNSLFYTYFLWRGEKYHCYSAHI